MPRWYWVWGGFNLSHGGAVCDADFWIHGRSDFESCLHGQIRFPPQAFCLEQGDLPRRAPTEDFSRFHNVLICTSTFPESLEIN